MPQPKITRKTSAVPPPKVSQTPLEKHGGDIDAVPITVVKITNFVRDNPGCQPADIAGHLGMSSVTLRGWIQRWKGKMGIYRPNRKDGLFASQERYQEWRKQQLSED